LSLRAVSGWLLPAPGAPSDVFSMEVLSTDRWSLAAPDKRKHVATQQLANVVILFISAT
jgi:hypothetical protein